MAKGMNNPSEIYQLSKVPLRARLGPILRRSVLQIRNRHILLLDLAFLLLIPALAMTLLQDSLAWWFVMGQAVVFFTLLTLPIQLAIFYKLGLYDCYWQYARVNDFAQIPLAVGASTAVITLLSYAGVISIVYRDLGNYHTLPLIVGLLAFGAVVGVRLVIRASLNENHHDQLGTVVKKRLLIVGAGEAGRIVAHVIQMNPQLGLWAVAFVDDDPVKVGKKIEGLRVAGTIEMVDQLVNELNLQEIIFAIPSAPLGRQKQIIANCKKSGVNVTSFPGVFDLLAGHKTIGPIPQIDSHSLLNRKPIRIDKSEMVANYKGAKVLVTGAGGSIGSGICYQVAQYDPDQIILVGHGENSIFEIALKLKLAFPDLETQSAIVDVKDAKGIDALIERSRPDVIFHAAAHKHVPYMEDFICEAITNNVLGTQNVASAAQRHNVPHFVLISSDKAVNPSSVMGVTKRISEIIVQKAARESGMAYISVRFGNVLGSRGSVLRVFQSQIGAGGPLTITHPQMQRFFMTIPEAVLLALQAASIGRGGEIFVLDMGEQVRILDLATRLIACFGLKVERDIKIVFSGTRPGEKLEEELFMSNENHKRTKHQKIFVAVNKDIMRDLSHQDEIAELIYLAKNNQSDAANLKLQQIVPEFQPPASVSTKSDSQNMFLPKAKQPEPHRMDQSAMDQLDIDSSSTVPAI